jgi:radical SAM superfamily enzyme
MEEIAGTFFVDLNVICLKTQLHKQMKLFANLKSYKVDKYLIYFYIYMNLFFT